MDTNTHELFKKRKLLRTLKLTSYYFYIFCVFSEFSGKICVHSWFQFMFLKIHGFIDMFIQPGTLFIKIIFARSNLGFQ